MLFNTGEINEIKSGYLLGSWYLTRAKMNNLINVVNILLQCCAAPCQQCCAALSEQLFSTSIVHSCSGSTIIVQSFVDNHQQACFINYCPLLFQQHCNNYCFLSTSNNYWSNNTHQHCQFNKFCWTLITTLFRRCWTNNVASTWWIFARVRKSIGRKKLSKVKITLLKYLN